MRQKSWFNLWVAATYIVLAAFVLVLMGSFFPILFDFIPITGAAIIGVQATTCFAVWLVGVIWVLKAKTVLNEIRSGEAKI